MTKAASVYGEALYALAREESLGESLMQQLSVLEESFAQEPTFLRLLAAPNITKQERCGILDSSLGDKVHPYVLNFLKILTERGYIRQFSQCCEAYREQYYADSGIVPVTAVTAVPLDENQTEKLKKKLSALLDKRVELTNRVQPGVLGGIRLDYSGKQLDGTVQNRLAAMRKQLKNTVL